MTKKALLSKVAAMLKEVREALGDENLPGHSVGPGHYINRASEELHYAIDRVDLAERMGERKKRLTSRAR
jgi:hypothetical protein